MKKSINLCNQIVASAGIVGAISAIGAFIGIFVAMFGYGIFVATVCIIVFIISLLLAATSACIEISISEEMEEEEN